MRLAAVRCFGSYGCRLISPDRDHRHIGSFYHVAFITDIACGIAKSMTTQLACFLHEVGYTRMRRSESANENELRVCKYTFDPLIAFSCAPARVSLRTRMS